MNWLFNVTINDISAIYVTAHRCAGGLKKKLGLRSGSQCHRHFVGFFNVPVQAPTQDQPFYTVIPTHRLNKSPFTTRLGYGGHILDLNPGPSRGLVVSNGNLYPIDCPKSLCKYCIIKGLNDGACYCLLVIISLVWRLILSDWVSYFPPLFITDKKGRDLRQSYDNSPYTDRNTTRVK